MKYVLRAALGVLLIVPLTSGLAFAQDENLPYCDELPDDSSVCTAEPSLCEEVDCVEEEFYFVVAGPSHGPSRRTRKKQQKISRGTDRPTVDRPAGSDFVDRLPEDQQEIAQLAVDNFEIYTYEQMEKDFEKMRKQIEDEFPGTGKIYIIVSDVGKSGGWITEEFLESIAGTPLAGRIEVIDITTEAGRDRMEALPEGSNLVILDDGIFSGSQINAQVGGIDKAYPGHSYDVFVLAQSSADTQSNASGLVDVHTVNEMPMLSDLADEHGISKEEAEEVFHLPLGPDWGYLMVFEWKVEPALVVSSLTFNEDLTSLPSVVIPNAADHPPPYKLPPADPGDGKAGDGDTDTTGGPAPGI